MFCTQCGVQLGDTEPNFCPSCGHQLPFAATGLCDAPAADAVPAGPEDLRSLRGDRGIHERGSDANPAAGGDQLLLRRGPAGLHRAWVVLPEEDLASVPRRRPYLK